MLFSQNELDNVTARRRMDGAETIPALLQQKLLLTKLEAFTTNLQA